MGPITKGTTSGWAVGIKVDPGASALLECTQLGLGPHRRSKLPQRPPQICRVEGEVVLGGASLGPPQSCRVHGQLWGSRVSILAQEAETGVLGGVQAAGKSRQVPSQPLRS